MVKKSTSIWGGIIQYEIDDIPSDVKFFNTMAKSPLLWLEHSKALHFSAVAISRTELNGKLAGEPVTLMLAGYAIETLLKMVIIYKFCEEHGVNLSDTEASYIMRTHKLSILAQKSGLRINKNDRMTMDILTEFTLWAGRYPVPLTQLGYTGPTILGYGPRRVKLVDVWSRYDDLYKKLYKLAVRKVFS